MTGLTVKVMRRVAFHNRVGLWGAALILWGHGAPEGSIMLYVRKLGQDSEDRGDNRQVLRMRQTRVSRMGHLNCGAGHRYVRVVVRLDQDGRVLGATTDVEAGYDERYWEDHRDPLVRGHIREVDLPVDIVGRVCSIGRADLPAGYDGAEAARDVNRWGVTPGKDGTNE